MNRRAFLSALTTLAAGAAASAVFDPELALWVPGQRSYHFLQSARGGVCNQLITPEWILGELRRINRQYNVSFKVGREITAGLSTRYGRRAS